MWTPPKCTTEHRELRRASTVGTSHLKVHAYFCQTSGSAAALYLLAPCKNRRRWQTQNYNKFDSYHRSEAWAGVSAAMLWTRRWRRPRTSSPAMRAPRMQVLFRLEWGRPLFLGRL